jgi:hypothetical protein
MRALRLIAVVLLILPVGAITLVAGAGAIAVTVAIWPFAFVRNTGNLLLEALLRELWAWLA